LIIMENKNRILLAVLAIVCIGLAYYLFSGSYGETSERGYNHAMTLISACNLKDLERVLRIQSTIAADVQSQSIAPAEARWLNAIVDHALSGDWETASRQVRKLMNAQVKAVQ